MTHNGTAPAAVLTPSDRLQPVSDPPPPWPSPTIALCDRAQQQVIRDCAEHADLTRQHDELMKAYIDLLQSGARLTCTPAQDRAFDICAIEQKIHSIEVRLVGRYPDHA